MQNIIQSFINLALSTSKTADPQVEKIAKERLEVCGNCEHRKNFVCHDCWCFLPAKVRGQNTCDKKYWTT